MFNQILCSALGLSFGMVTAVGAASFIAAIGIYPRLLSKLNATNHIVFAENVTMLGILAGCLLSMFDFSIPAGAILLPIAGFFIGIYVGCLLMTLAEVLQSFPIMFRRFHIKRGLSLLITSLALGKMFGSLYYFIMGIGN
ncbi:stage V sporulation protein AB [Lachnospiraceae bacterium XBB1006]|nr:stage V sporulation protein AB [Lachnospiraceae bacterium XBB1006]